MSDDNKIKDTAEAVKGIVEAVPVYEDAIQPAAKEVGKGLQTIAKSINVALAPLKALIWGYEQIEDFLKSKVAEKLKNTPPERITTPAANVAGPTIEALRFTGNYPDLRELYANLLATSLDSKTAKEAHPCFVEIIKQMVPDEAKIVRLLSDGQNVPIIDLQAKVEEGNKGHYDVLVNFSLLGFNAGCNHPELAPSYLNNLSRLGIVEIPPLINLTAPNTYEPLERHPYIIKAKLEIEKLSNHKPRIKRKVLVITSLGRQFIVAAVLDRQHN